MLYTLKGGYVYTEKSIKKINIIIENDKIIELSDNELGNIIDISGLYVAPGFIDPHVHMREPGFVESETIKTGSLACARGGYTKVFLMPNTNPVISSLEAYNNLLESDPVNAERVKKQYEEQTKSKWEGIVETIGTTRLSKIYN